MTRIVVLRPEPGASATVARAEAAGLEAVSIPLFEAVPVDWAIPDAGLFTAGETGHRQIELLRSKEKPFGPCDDMHRAVLIDDGIAGRGKCSPKRQCLVQRIAVLFEGNNAKAVRARDRSGIRLQRSGEKAQKSSLAAPVWTQEPQSLSWSQDEIDLADDRSAAQRFSELLDDH